MVTARLDTGSMRVDLFDTGTTVAPFWTGAARQALRAVVNITKLNWCDEKNSGIGRKRGRE